MPKSRARRRGAGRRGLAALLILSAVAGLTGCQTRGDSTSGSTLSQVVPVSGAAPTPVLPMTVTSEDGERVEIRDVSRVLAVNLSGTLAEIVFSLGLGDRVVGRDISSTFAQAKHLPLVTQAHDLSAEGVLALQPTLLLTDKSMGPPEALDAVRKAGVPVVLVPEAWSLQEIYPRITAVAAALGVPAAGRALVDRTRLEVTAALEAAPDGRPLRVAFLYLRGQAGVYLMGGKGSGADSMIEAIGATDAGSAIGLEKFRPLTSEGLIRAAPDVLVLMDGGLESVGGMQGLLKVAGVAQTPAGKARRVVTMNDGTLLSFGPRTGQVVRELAARVYATAGP